MTTQTTTTSEGAKDDQMFTFDDIEIYMKCEYRGHKGWIVEKGDHILERGGSNARHILVKYDPGEEMAGRDESRLHERIVNKSLRKNGQLWVDFGYRMMGEHNA